MPCKHTICYNCSSECGLLVTGTPPQRLQIYGDPGNPMNRGRICSKAALAEELRTSPSRVLAPLRRTGPRGTGTFVPVSWDEALDDIARRLRSIRSSCGPDALTILFGEKPDHDMVYDLAAVFGTPNILDHNSLCDTSRRLGFSGVFGEGQERPLPDLQRPLPTEHGMRTKHDCRLLVLFGENPAEAKRFFWLWEGIRQAVHQGMKLIAVDPMKTKTAQLADRWLAIRPGTDHFLLAAILRHVLETRFLPEAEGAVPPLNLRNGSFVQRHTIRFDELFRHLVTDRRDPVNNLTAYSIPWASDRTGLAEEEIASLAHDMAVTAPMCGMTGMNGVSHHAGGFSAAQILAVITALTGNLDVPGGLILREHIPLARPSDTLPQRLGEQFYRHKDLFSAYPLARHGVVPKIPEDILSGFTLSRGPFAGEHRRTKALIAIHANPLLTAPGSLSWQEALTAVQEDGRYLLKLFVVNATVLNETARFADYILPMAHFLERQGVVVHETVHPAVSLRQKAAPLPGMVRSPLELWKDLAKRLCPEAPLPPVLGAEDDDAWCNLVLSPLREHFGDEAPCSWLRRHGSVLSLPVHYRKYEKDGFATPSRKIDLFPEGLRRLDEDTSLPRRTGKLPRPPHGRWFHLISGRSGMHTHTLTQDLYPENSPCRHLKLLMNDKDAEEWGFHPGEEVCVSNAEGRNIIARLELCSGLRRGVLRGQHGWGTSPSLLRFPLYDAYNINLLTDAHAVDPITGNAWFGDVPVTVEHLAGERESTAAEPPGLPCQESSRTVPSDAENARSVFCQSRSTEET